MSDNRREYERFAKHIDKVAQGVFRGAQETAKEIVRDIQSGSKVNAPVDTGALRDSIDIETKLKSDSFEATVYTDIPYAVYVEYGTGPVGDASPKDIIGDISLVYRQTPWVYPGVDSNGEEAFIFTYGQPAKLYFTKAIRSTEAKNWETKLRENIDKEVKRS